MTPEAPGPPKLMLITSAPWSVASVIDLGDQRVLDRLRICDLLVDQLAGEGGAGDPYAVVALAARQPGDVGAMPHLIVLRPRARWLKASAATGVVVALRVGDPPRQIGIARRPRRCR